MAQFKENAQTRPSAFFIDNDTRKTKYNIFSATFILKSCFLLNCTYFTYPEVVTKRKLLLWLCCLIFVVRLFIQMFWIWTRGISWLEAICEAGVIIEVPFLSWLKNCQPKTSFVQNLLSKNFFPKKSLLWKFRKVNLHVKNGRRNNLKFFSDSDFHKLWDATILR